MCFIAGDGHGLVLPATLNLPWQSLPLLGFLGHFFTMLRMPTPCIWVFGTTHWIIERPVSSLSLELDQRKGSVVFDGSNWVFQS